ncbi:MAG: Fe-S cluster assembly protein SufD [Oscillospiraceae bacterium]
MDGVFKHINEIPVLTWSWLEVNDASMKEEFPPVGKYNKTSVAGTVPQAFSVSALPAESSFSGQIPKINAKQEVRDYIAAHQNSAHFVRIKKNRATKEPLFLSYELDTASPVLVDETVIVAEEGSRATVIIRYTSAENGAFYHSGSTRIYAAKNAEIKLVKVQMLADTAAHVDHVAVLADADAKVQVILAELGARQSVTNCAIDLTGENSEAAVDSIYLGDKQRLLDLNYRIAHKVPNTVSNIHSNGVLADTCEKVFRATIDFISGSSNSKGREEEYTVLLGPDVKNISTPLLLCGEENVEGAHASSTGKLDTEKLFYLTTRGFTETEAKKFIIEAAFTPVLEKMENPPLQQEVMGYISNRLRHI